MGTTSAITFRMFNEEYEYSTNQLVELLHIPYGEGVLCQAPIETEWSADAFAFWEQIIGAATNSFEGNVASQIHNRPYVSTVKCWLTPSLAGKNQTN